MKRMLTTEQIKKVENNCGAYRQTKPLFAPFTKESNYYSSSKRLDVRIDIDFTNCLPGYTYTLDWWNPKTNESDKFLNHNWPSDTWAEAINQWRDIDGVQLSIYVWGLKSGINFELPLSLFATEENKLYIKGVYAKTKDEDKECIIPIMQTYDEQKEYGKWHVGVVGGFLNPFWGSSTAERDHSLTFQLRTTGPMVYVAGGW